jgi:hypothetical protein
MLFVKSFFAPNIYEVNVKGIYQYRTSFARAYGNIGYEVNVKGRQ